VGRFLRFALRFRLVFFAFLFLAMGAPMITQNVPSTARVAAGAFGFLTFIHVLDGPDL
jgi:hypothetical protein